MVGWRVSWAPYPNRKEPAMGAFPEFDRQKARGFVSALCCGLLAASLALASGAYAAGGGGGGGGGGGAGSGGGALNQAEPRAEVPSDLTVCKPGQAWDTKRRKCLVRRSDVLPDPEMTEYAYALAKADRYPEAIDVLDLLRNPNRPRALNYRGYATRKLGRTDEGIGYYLKSVTLDPNYPQVREYLGEAYVTKGNYELAREQLSTIEKLCGKDCEYYEDLAKALTE